VNKNNLINAETNSRASQAAASALRPQLHVLHAGAPQDFDTVFATLAKLRPIGLVITNDQFLTSRVDQLGALTDHHAVPAIFQFREFAVAGGLMDITAAYRLVGAYTGRIL
jgi:putative ABC transport system substrate-binding protein